VDQLAPLQPNNSEAQLREEAINRYIGGERPTEICRELGRSRTWFYKTLQRYQQQGRNGLQSRSRAPHQVANRTAEKTEQAIVRVRQAIVSGQEASLRYSNIGAELIAAELQRAGIEPPSLVTINRILRRHGLQRPWAKQRAQSKLPEDYPWPCVQQPNQLHLLDFVTRTTRSIRRLYSCHLLDQARQWPFLRIITTKNRDNVAQFLVSAWQEIGLPQNLYIDNDTVWRGSSYGQRSFSYIVRLCLLLGVEVIFTPAYSPEANPLIEGFNGIWDRNFWQRTEFGSLTHLETELDHFERWARERRPLPNHNRQSPQQLFPDFQPQCLPLDFELHRQPTLPLTEGFVHFIRFVDQQGGFSLLNEQWLLPTEPWAGKTIRATIDVAQQQLFIYHQPRPEAACTLVTQFAYPLAEQPLPLAAVYQRDRLRLWPFSELFDC
jgi:hypothetical protein